MERMKGKEGQEKWIEWGGWEIRERGEKNESVIEGL